jgi:hypothetical protein
MPDVLDRLDQLVPDTTEIDVDPAWTVVQRRTTQDRHRRRGAQVLGAVATLAVAAVLVGQLTSGDDDTSVATRAEEPTEPGFTRLPEMPIEPTTNPAIAALPGGDVFVWGGYTPGSVGVQLHEGAVYDAATETWEQLPPLPDDPAQPMNEARAAWTGDEVVMIASPGTDPSPVYRWSPETGEWARGVDGDSTCGSGGGGVDQPAWLTGEVYVPCEDGRIRAYDPVADTWRTLPPSPELMAQPVLVVMDDQLAAVGEFEVDSWPPTHVGAYRYDPATDVWNDLSVGPVSMIQAEGLAAVWTGDEVVLLDGLGDVSVLDPSTGEVALQPSVPLAEGSCRTYAAAIGTSVVVRRCDVFAARLDDGWAVVDAPNGSLNGAVGANALFVSADDGVWQYRPPAPSVDDGGWATSVVPLGTSELRPPPDADVVEVHEPTGTVQGAAAELAFAGGGECIVVGGADPRRLAEQGSPAQIDLGGGEIVAGSEVVGLLGAPSASDLGGDPALSDLDRHDLRGVAWHWQGDDVEQNQVVQVICDDPSLVTDLTRRIDPRQPRAD